MIIGIDARVLQEGNGGIFVYAKNLLEHLIPLAKKHKIKLFLNQYKKSESKVIDELLNNENVKKYQYHFPNKFLNASLKFAKWPNIDDLIDGCDVLFFPSMMYSSWSKKTKTVLTMHDLSYEFFPECFTRKQKIWHNLMNPRDLCNSVSKIIAVSKSTMNDISETYKIDKKKIKTVYSGINDIFHPVIDSNHIKRIRNKYNLPEAKYIIQTGTLEPRKNHIATIDAFSKWTLNHTTESKNWRLLFVGHNGWKSSNIFLAVRKSLFSDRIHIINEVPLVDMPALYSLSQISIYPSFYEGFGFPPLESASCGVAVIASANSSLGEIIGDAGILINPYRIDEIISAIRSLINSNALCQSLRAKGLAKSAEFSWEKTAQETLKQIESV